MKLTHALPSVILTCALGVIGMMNIPHTHAKDKTLHVHMKRFVHAVPDSVGVEVSDGKLFIIHKLEPKETYYGLSRKYAISVSEIIQANNNKALKIGETVRIPTGRPAVAAQTPNPAGTKKPLVSAGETENTAPAIDLPEGSYTTYIIGRGETLYSVSKRFRVPVESIKLANGLRSDAIREGMHLRVPKEPIQEPTSIATGPVLQAADVIDTSSLAQDGEERRAAEMELAKKNKYGLRETTEKGVGVWIEDLNQDGASMLALHKNVPVGTVVKVTNPMTNHSTFVKVVGKFVDNAETQGAIIVLSKSVASVIGIIDRRFPVEIAYGAPVESSK